MRKSILFTMVCIASVGTGASLFAGAGSALAAGTPGAHPARTVVVADAATTSNSPAADPDGNGWW